MFMQDKIIESLTPLEPRSIFLYGSRGRGDHREDSDWEIGVVFEDEKIVRRKFLQERVRLDSAAAYPFKLSDVIAGKFNNPFVDSIFARELAEGAKTIYGQAVVENLKPPKITALDLLAAIRFSIGCAFSAVLAHRNGEFKIASKEFYDSCLFGLRLLIILQKGEFVCKPGEIYKRGLDLKLQDRHSAVIEHAHMVRARQRELQADMAFDNLVLLDFIEQQILLELKLNGDSELV